MMRISLLKTVFRTLVFFLFALPLFGQTEVGFTIQPVQNGNDVTADFTVYNFNDILSMQFSLSWDPAEMEFVSAEGMALPGLTGSNFGSTLAGEGTITFSWLDPNVSGVSVPDCAPIFTLNFQTVSGNTTAITVGGDPTPDKIIDSNGESIDWIQSSFCLNASTLSGNVYNDLNDNCLYDVGESGMENWIIQFDGNGTTNYVTTDVSGNYSKSLFPGTYDISIILPENDLWTACTPTQIVSLDTFENKIVDFPSQAFLDCPSLSVDFTAPFLRRCLSSNYHVYYCNDGTLVATDAYVEIEFDSYLNILSSSLPWSAVNGNVYTFPIGDVETGDCGSFYVEVEVDCDAVLGQTHCSTAHIFPDDPCVPTNPLWDGSDLEITGICDGDSVRFEIKNLGDDMAEPLEFIVIEDDMIFLTSDPIQLLSQASTSLVVEANGSTWRVEMPEASNHPHETFTTDAVEGCGTNGGGSFSLGFVTQFPEDEENPAIDEDCQENIGSFDPNDKIGYPKGFCAAHYIRADQNIEYKIRFQNTGTDTAFNIVVVDTLSLFLDPTRVKPGASSHPYDFEINGEGVLEFSFANVMLPDSNVNEQASHGFVKFTVSQKHDLPTGTLVNNTAAIYFDFNEPVLTNMYSHTIGDDFVEMAGQSGDLSVSGYVNAWYGGPVEDVVMTMTNLCPVFTDSYGYFLFENIDSAVYTMSATKENDDPVNGVTVLDLVKITPHILGLDQLNYYQIVAADANGSTAITTFDLVLLRKIILGLSVGNNFSEWKFVTTDFDPDQPTLGSTIYEYAPLSTSLDAQDFIAIQPGNVITESMVETSSINTEFYFEPNQVDDNTLWIDVKANDFTTVNAFQYGLKWDDSIIQLTDIESGVLTSGPDSWSSTPNSGRLAIAHFQGIDQGTTVSSDEVLFTLVFNITAPINSSTLIELDGTNIPLQVVVDTCKLASASVTGTEITIEDVNAVIDFGDIGLQVKVAPNPVRQGQVISLEITTATARRLAVQLFDMNGAMHHAGTFQSPTGKSVYPLNADLRKGIYFMKIDAGEGVERTAKLVVY